MAVNILDNGSYSFTPATGTIVINRWIPAEDITRIVNATSGGIIYDPTGTDLKASSYSASVSDKKTTIVLFTNTKHMKSTDDLQIFVDDSTAATALAESSVDPVDRLRVSQIESLIDSDFEYGLNQGKWENLGMTNNRPYAFTTSTSAVTGITGFASTAGSRTVTVTLAAGSGLAAGDVISVQDTYYSQSNGVFTVDSVSGSGVTSFTYTARSAFKDTIANFFDSSKVVVFKGSYYTNSRIGGGTLGTITATYTNLTTYGSIITVELSNVHGLSIGNEIEVDGLTGGGTVANGSFVVTGVPSTKIFTYFCPNQPSAAITTGSGAIYSRSQGLVVHRPYDGGVIFSANAASNYESQIRQTRKYFRYQAGKGISMASGIVLKPSIAVDSIKQENAPQGIVITTKEQHNIQPGVKVTISGADIVDGNDVNKTYTVSAIFGPNMLFIGPLDNTLPTFTGKFVTGQFNLNVSSWYGAENKIGMFDQQNGAYWNHDGQTLSVNRRYSTFQIAGRVSVTKDATLVTGSAISATQFTTQLKPGDYVVIRGSSYRIASIQDDSTLRIQPSYRGPSADEVIVTKTNEVRINSSSFNIDKLDGTGPSGYNIDTTKMQMFYVDYSWYGAGAIRFGVRDLNGKIIYCHKIVNNNTNNEAYMRSGNLPARYETVTNPPKTYSTTTIATDATSITVNNSTGFPTSGTLVIRDETKTEHINYTGIDTTGGAGAHKFTGITRVQAGSQTLTASSTVQPTPLYGSFIVNDITGLQIGQRIVARSSTCAYPDNTYITKIVAGTGTTGTITTSALLTGSLGTTAFTAISMGGDASTAFTASASAPLGVELAYPNYSPSLSHWGTSVLMEGRKDDTDAALINYTMPTSRTFGGNFTATGANGTAGSTTISGFSSTSSMTVGQLVTFVSGSGALNTTSPTYISSILSGVAITVDQPIATTLSNAVLQFSCPTYALFSVRLAPSVDNGVPTNFGVRDLINRAQLVLKSLNVATTSATGNMYVTAILNGKPSTSTTWSTVPPANNSLAQVAPHAALNVMGTVSAAGVQTPGGDLIGGWYVTGVGDAINISGLPTLGNSILGGGSTTTADGFFPDGPDTITICVKNLGSSSITAGAALSWTEAQG